jgi:hypothetical protein
VWVPQKINVLTGMYIPAHYEYICSEDESVKDESTPCCNNNPSPPLVGGCAGTRYGCCPSDGKTSKVDAQGSNCPAPTLIGGCAGTRYGCCKDGKTSKRDEIGSNCGDNKSCWSTCPAKCHDECIHYKVRQRLF